MSSKWALIIANADYADPKLAKLTAPTKDAEAFADILKARDLAAFDDVTTVINQPEPVARRAIAKFFVDRKPHDLLLLYFSGHGIRDDQGHLFLAMTDTEPSMLDATAISSDFITRQMDNTRSRRQLLILDCCNSGAFASGTKAASEASMGTASAFEGTGYGRVVLTATDTTQFAWEGDKIIGEETTNSLFTHFLVKGLEGEADGNADGVITVDELYDYAYSEIVRRTPKQTPGKWTYREQGQIVLTTKVKPQTIKPVSLDPDLEQDLQSTRNYVREAAVSELGNLLYGPNLGRALSAELKLKYVADNDDSRAIARKAAQLLEQYQASRGIPVAIPASEPHPVEEAPVTKSEIVSKESSRSQSAPPSRNEANTLKSNVLPAAHVAASSSQLEWRRYALVAAIGVLVLGAIGAVWRALRPVPAAPSQSVQSLTSISSQVHSTVIGTAPAATTSVLPQLGTWGIDYFQGTQLSGRAAYHTAQPAEQNAGGGYTLQYSFAQMQNNPEVPSLNFSMRLSGLFYFSGGMYDFHCEHQDGCRVYVDGERSIDAWSDGSGSHDAERAVPAGNHIVNIEYYDNGGQGSLQVLWLIKLQSTSSPTVTETAAGTPTKLPIATPTRPKKDKGGAGGGSICLAFGTTIDTPNGPMPVQELAIGDLVWTQDTSGARIATPITRTRQAAVPANTKLLLLILSDGREIRVSPSHPSAEGRPLRELQPGDWLDGRQVVRVESITYGYAHTYDILPAGPTGVYWADGILLGSTLKYDVVP